MANFMVAVLLIAGWNGDWCRRLTCTE